MEESSQQQVAKVSTLQALSSPTWPDYNPTIAQVPIQFEYHVQISKEENKFP